MLTVSVSLALKPTIGTGRFSHQLQAPREGAQVLHRVGSAPRGHSDSRYSRRGIGSEGGHPSTRNCQAAKARTCEIRRTNRIEPDRRFIFAMPPKRSGRLTCPGCTCRLLFPASRGFSLCHRHGHAQTGFVLSHHSGVGALRQAQGTYQQVRGAGSRGGARCPRQLVRPIKRSTGPFDRPLGDRASPFGAHGEPVPHAPAV